MLKTVLVFIFSLFPLSALELPTIELNESVKPHIVIFKATNILVDEKSSYEIEWKTTNSTHVQLTYLGKVNLSYSIIITEDEYNRGPITLTASSQESDFSDSKTINLGVKSKETDIIIMKQSTPKTRTYQNYNTHPYRRRYNQPYRRY